MESPLRMWDLGKAWRGLERNVLYFDSFALRPALVLCLAAVGEDGVGKGKDVVNHTLLGE